ncbi:rhomboid family intramembrane serine protease [Candidatus Leptofilum sp.]|uniref:rhomboid family intramembrane serine protease n=1 Tax=Candidatus Leptofilum sp. TaxID=3241576 RepID=UPI003B5BA206
MFRWLRNSIRTIWGFILFATIIVVGYWLMMGGLWIVRHPQTQAVVQGSAEAVALLGRFETAVKLVGGLFLFTWVLRFLDRYFLREALSRQLGFVARGPLSLFRMFFSNFLHGNMDHLVGNTRPLLGFTAVTVLLLPRLDLLLPLFIFMVVVQSVGVWIFGRRLTPHIGASGLVLGLFSFDVTHGIFAGGWKTAVAFILLIVSGKMAYRALISRGAVPGGGGAQISVVGHVWGFLSGIFAAYLISPFGPLFELAY